MGTFGIIRLTALAGVALWAALLPAPPALAQRVCSIGDTACEQQRMVNTRQDTIRRMGRDDARPHLPQRYYGDRYAPGGQTGGGCDVKPVISGQNTRVVRTC